MDYVDVQRRGRHYWRGLSAQCVNQSSAALTALRAAYPKLALDKKTQPLAVEAAARVAVLERALIQRAEAADTYNELMRLWALPTVTASAMGMDDATFALRRIDEALWASRYRTMVSDYENAKLHAQTALNHVATALTSRTIGGSNVKRKAGRVARRGLSHARIPHCRRRAAIRQCAVDVAPWPAVALSGPRMERPAPMVCRRLRLPVRPVRVGEEEMGKRYSLRPKTTACARCFISGLPRLTIKWVEKAESRFYLSAGIDDYPLSYYSTVAPAAAGLTAPRDWRKVFGDAADLPLKLHNAGDLQIDKLRRHKTYGRLVNRAEILAAAKLTSWLKLAADELDQAISAELTVENNVVSYLYMTRLHYAAGNYLKAIGMTTKLAKAEPNFWKKYPEQILIYFPQPFREIYERNSLEQNIDRELLMAISRQESGFTPDIRSPANALGVMQLIHPTAERFATELGMPTNDLDTLLKTPAANIRMGAKYLKVLQLTYKGYEPAVFGGYNAGEYSIDLWLKRRANSDMLMFVELVPFGETKDYIKNVWRNVAVYRYLMGIQDLTPGRLNHENNKPSNRADIIN